MKNRSEMHRLLLRGIHKLNSQHMEMQHNNQYNQGWDDAMCSVETLVNRIFTARYDQSPLDHRLDAELTQGDLQVSVNDPVNHPSHYTYGKIEVIDFLEDQKFPYHLGNVVKYICRAGKKDPDKTIEDLEKAVWYLNRYISLLRKEGTGE